LRRGLAASQANRIDPVDVAGNRQSSARMVQPGAPFEPQYF
jgi:hypothetical protein